MTSRTLFVRRSLQILQQQHQQSVSQARQAVSGAAVRCQSSWVTPSSNRRRNKNRYLYPQTGRQPQQAQAASSSTAISSFQNQRPVVNGKPVAFHIRDLQNDTSSQTSQTPSKPKRHYDSDLIVVLDMDECIIHSQFLQGGAGYAHQVQRKGWEEHTHSVDTFTITLPEGERVKVHERPGLHDFLKKVTQKYETHIFTAAMEVYAKPVLQQLDPDGTLFAQHWYRESCDLNSEIGAYVKNLDNLTLGTDSKNDLSRVVLVDNNPLSFLTHPSNGILVSSFYNDPNDTTLPAVLELLDELDSSSKDVRPILEQRFGLPDALQEIIQKQQQQQQQTTSNKMASTTRMQPPPTQPPQRQTLVAAT